MPEITPGVRSAPEVDDLAVRFLQRGAPVCFTVADAHAVRRETWRLRYEVSVERGWMRPEDAPDGTETDEYDADAVILAGWDDGQIIATSRLVLPRPCQRLPTEAAFDVQVEPYGHVINVDRMLVRATHRDPTHRIFAALMGATWLEMRRRGFLSCLGATSPATIRLYRLLGLRILPLAPPRLYRGEVRHPCIFTASDDPPPLPT